jgi:hypothetical protein
MVRRINALIIIWASFGIISIVDSFQANRSTFSTKLLSPRAGLHHLSPSPIAGRLKNPRRSSPLLKAAQILSGGGGAPSFVGLGKNSYFLTRVVFLRALAFVYGVAFLVAKHQNKALIGDNGITPARTILDAAEERGEFKRQRRDTWLESTVFEGPAVDTESRTPFAQLKNSQVVRSIGTAINRYSRYQYWRERLWDRQDGAGRPITTLLWLAKDRTTLNPWLDGIANWGIGMSLAVFLLGAANMPLMLGLWICQRSLMAVGGPWYGYGWEPQLAELGFHALFLVPFLSMRPIAAASPPSPIVIYAIRWYLFRIMLGAGLIKLKSGDIKWKWPNLSAMSYFYETQPVPNPWTRYFHWKSAMWHNFRFPH